jgi:biopolymer transport protein ExbD
MAIANKQSGGEEPINLMPLIDMVFLLLIFFLVATTFSQDEREQAIRLAQTSNIPPASAQPPQLIINIMEDGTVKVSGSKVGREQLATMLETIVRDDPDREVVVRADEESIHKYFAGVMNLCLKKGIKQANISYLAKNPERLPPE